MFSKHHLNITGVVLKKHLSPDYLKRGKSSSWGPPDAFILPWKRKIGLGFDPQHFTRGNAPNTTESLDRSLKYVEKLENFVLGKLEQASKQRGIARKVSILIALGGMGRIFHAYQDFYSHTNWVMLTAPKSKVWNGSTLQPNLDKPELLKNCLPNHWLVHVILPVLKIVKKVDYKHYLDPTINLKHSEMNLDGKKSRASKGVKKSHGVNGFKLAKSNAIRHSKREWEKIMTELEERIGEKKARKFEKFLKTDRTGIISNVLSRLLTDCELKRAHIFDLSV